MSKKVIRWVVAGAAVLALGGVSLGQGPRGFMGVQLDPASLPELLTKHLGLDPNQGIRILNVSEGGPAYNVGLDRDDIIILFQGKKVGNADEFVQAVRELPVRSRITLEVIQSGKHKVVTFELAPAEGEPKWKYPVEAEFQVSWGPGRILRLGPNGWVEVPFSDMPDLKDLPMMKRLFNERYLYRHVTDGENYTIAVEGDPKDDSTDIVVQSGPTEYKATVGTIDSLPEKYRAAARESVEVAKRSSSQKIQLGGKFALPAPPDADLYRQYFNNIALPKIDPNALANRRDLMIERLQSEVEQLQQRLKQMENHIAVPDKSEKNAPAAKPAEPGSSSKSTPEPTEKPKPSNSGPI